MNEKNTIRNYGYLLHITHYDPAWCTVKAKEKPFDLPTGLALVEALAAEGFTHLVIDLKDGVAWRSHPELRKHYTVPMSVLRKLVAAARKAGLDIVPKLNFSQSEINRHNHWMIPPGEIWWQHFDEETYWRRAFEIIDEAVEVCRPARYVHIGMDEDHNRSYDQYVTAIRTLRIGLRKRGLRTMMWNDSAIAYGPGFIHRDKAIYAEARLPKDVTQVLWNYSYVPTQHIGRIAKEGFELWGAPGWRKPDQAREFVRQVRLAGGKGLLLTRWEPCRPANRKAMIEQIRAMGPIFRGEA
jgi:hypothetical protein